MDKRKINYVLLGLTLGSLVLAIADYATMRGLRSSPEIYYTLNVSSNSIAPQLVAMILLTYYSVISSRKYVAIVGSVSLLLAAGYILTSTGQIYQLIFALIEIVGSAVLLFALSRNKSAKRITLCALTLLALYNLLELLIPFVLLRAGFYGDSGVAAVISNSCRWVSRGVVILYFVTLGIYVWIDGKPFEKKTMPQKQFHKKEYIPTPKNDSNSLAEQLNNLKQDFESGKMSDEEYKKRRIELLKDRK